MVKTEARETAQSPGSALYGIYIVSLATCLLGNLLIRVGAEAAWFGPGARIVIALLTCVPLVAAAGFFWRLLRRDGAARKRSSSK